MCVFEDVFGHLWNHLAAILSPTSLSFTGLGRSIRTCYIFSGVYMRLKVQGCSSERVRKVAVLISEK